MKSLIHIILYFFLASLPLLGAEPDAMKEINLISIIKKGGWVMGVLGVLSIITLMLVVLYLLILRRGNVVTSKFMNAAEALIRKRDYLGLITYCRRRNESIARITSKTLDFLTKNPNATHTDIREVAEAEASRQAGTLTQRISYLADIASIAPMIGLLGTVIGMIKSFIDISRGDFEGVKQLQMAEGVWQALITTAGGLSVGIIAIIFYSLFRGRVQKLISEMEAAAAHILALTSGQIQQNNQGLNQFDPNENYAANQPPSPMREASIEFKNQ